MASSCITNCMNDVAVHLPIRRLGSIHYVRLSEQQQQPPPLLGGSGRFASFEEQCGRPGHPKVVDSVSCRQLYLRSYTFSRKESFNDRTKRRIGEVAESVKKRGLGFRLLPAGRGEGREKKKGKKKGVVVRRRSTAVMCLGKARRVTCRAVMKVVRRLMMSCTTRVDTAADGD
ncbi:unnamed protein product [Linum trigynum]|uniref:Uncharacterized protein n=1 Tax=Linum trigynum TaxID=586398 RepID=A0AAV2FY07_9ROSI